MDNAKCYCPESVLSNDNSKCLKCDGIEPKIQSKKKRKGEHD